MDIGLIDEAILSRAEIVVLRLVLGVSPCPFAVVSSVPRLVLAFVISSRLVQSLMTMGSTTS